jgi:3-dehydroquinate synthase
MVSFFSDIPALNQTLFELTRPYSSVFILFDENTVEYCLPLITPSLSRPHTIQISSGEENKNLHTCGLIWTTLTEQFADRKSLLINLGGGVITDMGGFAGSCYKRGIDFINIPTTLLAMVDASVGGKTGIDFDEYKNQIGVFNEAKEVLICPSFLETLDKRQIFSGHAEVIKHYLIADGQSFLNYDVNDVPGIDMIRKAVEIKSSIVMHDPLEKNVRKKLNFGHTIGHALESYKLKTSAPLLHGEAVAYGMAIETVISGQKSLMGEEKAEIVVQKLQTDFALRRLSEEDVDGLMAYIYQDKKNENGRIKMSLIDNIGSCLTDIEISTDEVKNAIAQFNSGLKV